ncbi:ABC transporter ATP-binding protein [Paraburkholderia bonniea]|uniref:ABC transporter ATP-binding protein n=1 Tax=Paraburkholderia bonniea TaxID=2152891 RepID=UPI0012929B81|nr:ABC transporter ATP-binding protein [Paraburkholderia bonniea]WJF89169.1 ABC transporter ATP-binding protein [Paraburkholderia bonniea]WJF92485.1 ABC transporter ATP-binding protein [Paraburkholderia bonniea]
MPALLTLDAVCKRFGAYTALDQISLDIRQGEFIALLGPSGCGKTTLLRAIAGFMTPDRGRIVIDGEDVTHLPPYRRPLNTVFQNYALFAHMSVLENVAYGPRRQGVSRREAAARAQGALEMVGLEALGARYPREMSGGQQQRVALARAIVNRPKLLLLDEPLSALDMKLRRRMQLELKHLQEKLGIAFVFVTHDQEEAMTMADRIVVMNAGRIEQVGAGTEIYRAPATRFVTEFIGEANLLPFRTVAGGFALALPGLLPAVLPLPRVDVPAQGIAVLRPEQLQLLDSHGHGSALDERGLCSFSATLAEVVSVGSHTMLHVDAGGQRLVARVMGLPGAEVRKGSAVRLGFAPAALHLLGETA